MSDLRLLGSKTPKEQATQRHNLWKGNLHVVQEKVSMLQNAVISLTNYDAETDWIRKNIDMRVCKGFVEDVENVARDHGNKLCHCGYTRKAHREQGSSRDQVSTWDWRTHTKQTKTNAFGEIEFVGYGDKLGKYIRVDTETKMRGMLHLMMSVWGMERPNLLISVTGGAKHVSIKRKLKETFQRGLMKAAQSTGAWIITGGTRAGVMKYVGQAVKDYGMTYKDKKSVTAIGIASWGCVQNKKDLENDEFTGLWPARYRLDDHKNKNENFLDPNHSHFILVDNGTQHKSGTEIPFRVSLQGEITKLKTDAMDDGVHIPIICLVLEGGFDTLDMVYQTIQNNTPVVIVQGSGFVADVLAYAYHNSRQVTIESKDKGCDRVTRHMEESVKAEVEAMLRKLDELKELSDGQFAKYMTWIEGCLDRCELLTIYNIDDKSDSPDIDVAILKAMMKANSNPLMDQLRLALAWNRIDVAKTEIFTDETSWATGTLSDMMLTAILLNRVDFVELFMDNGVCLREFLTVKRLLTLYNKIPRKSMLYRLLTKIRRQNNKKRVHFSLADVGTLLQCLLGNYYMSEYLTLPEVRDLDVDTILDENTVDTPNTPASHTADTPNTQANHTHDHHKEKISKQASFDNGSLASDISDTECCDHGDDHGPKGVENSENDLASPVQHLFIWAVLSNRMHMAKFFWTRGKDALTAALVGYSILKAIAKRSGIAHDMEHAREFSDLAIGLLKECYATDVEKIQNLLVRIQPHWGDTTCIKIAVKSNNRDFMAQPACQTLLNNIWMGKISKANGTLRLQVCVLAPFLVPVLIRFRQNFQEQNKRLNEQLEGLEETGVTGKENVSSTNRRFKFRKSGRSKSIRRQESCKLGEESAKERNRWFSLVWLPLYAFFTAPVVKCMYNVLSYVVFLALFSYILIVRLEHDVSIAEVVLMVWVFTIFTEEVRQVLAFSSDSLKSKLQCYITDFWNITDAITIGLFILGMVLRFLPNPNTLELARVILNCSLIAFFLRILHIFSIHKELGPKLVMIGKMMRDLMFFVVILLVFVMSYAVASHSILYPNSSMSWGTLVDVIRRPYWNIYGELFLEEFEDGNNCGSENISKSNMTGQHCPSEVGRYVVPVMMGFYMLIANVLLLNLLIAMFSYTFQSVQDNTDLHWHFQRYSLIYEYYTRPVLAPPLILLSHILLLCRRVGYYCCCGKVAMPEREDDLRRKFPNERELVQWESVIADSFFQKKDMKKMECSEHSETHEDNSTADILTKLERIQEQQDSLQKKFLDRSGTQKTFQSVAPAHDVVVSGMSESLDQKVNALELQIENTFNALDHAMRALHDLQTHGSASLPVSSRNSEEFKADNR